MKTRLPLRAAALCVALLSACGGGSDVLPPLPGVTCSAAEQRVWLDGHVDEHYFWYRLAPSVSPLPDRSVAEYFKARLYAGSDARFPADRWSGMEDKADFDRFFGDGRTLGYGLFLAGLEITGQPGQPLKVRYIEPRSDAAAQGVQRGDEVVSANGRAARDIVAADDFGVFTPGSEGQTLALVLRREGATRNVRLRATVYDLTPVSLGRVLPSPQGRRMGYLHVKDMISQAEAGLASTFDDFKSAGVQDLVIDLRYNGGGLVSLANRLASYVTGSRHDGNDFVRLLFNDKRARADNATYRLENPRQGLGLSRVYVLAGPRTCSASELVVNGLRPYVDVVMVGDTTCGKPVGFVPVDRCDTVFSLVNFESVNARDEGRYFDGIQPTCAVADDLSRPLGDRAEALLAEARQHADSGRCSAPQAQATRRRALQGLEGRIGGEPRERQGMWAR